MPVLLAPPPITDATRREFLALLATTGLLTSCAADRATDPTEAPTRTFVDSLGRSVDVPARPRRIVATQAVAGEALLALGAPRSSGWRPRTPGSTRRCGATTTCRGSRRSAGSPRSTSRRSSRWNLT